MAAATTEAAGAVRAAMEAVEMRVAMAVRLGAEVRREVEAEKEQQAADRVAELQEAVHKVVLIRCISASLASGLRNQSSRRSIRPSARCRRDRDPSRNTSLH